LMPFILFCDHAFLQVPHSAGLAGSKRTTKWQSIYAEGVRE
jgi:hypothetical protein